jgi:hypothetical protein
MNTSASATESPRRSSTSSAPTPLSFSPALAGLRNAAQIQAALAQVAVRLAARTIDDKRAGLILYALQSSVLNLANSPAARLPRILDAAPLRRRRRAFRWQPRQLESPLDAVILSESQSDESKACPERGAAESNGDPNTAHLTTADHTVLHTPSDTALISPLSESADAASQESCLAATNDSSSQPLPIP